MSQSRSDEFVRFVRSRPPSVQRLMREWPPLAVVRAREGVVLLVPAPGVEGTVQSYFEDGSLGVVAPATIPHPVHGWGDAEPGQMLKATVRPDQLEFVREGEWTRVAVEDACK